MKNYEPRLIGMSRHILSLSHKQLTTFDLDAFIAHAEALNQHHRDTFATPFPKAPSRWLSHYEFMLRPIAFTSQGDVDGGLSWLVGGTVDFRFTRALCAPYYGARGGPCYDPASLILLEVATKVDQYVDYAQFCRDLHDRDKGRPTGNSPVSTTPFQAKMICAIFATASGTR